MVLNVYQRLVRDPVAVSEGLAIGPIRFRLDLFTLFF